MKKLIAVLISLGLPCTAEADSPFNPYPAAADHVVAMKFSSVLGAPKSGTHTVYHHGNWTRIDRVIDGNASTRYFGNDSTVLIELSERGENGRSLWLRFRKHEWKSKEVDTTPVDTGEQRTILGETCTLWRIWSMGRGAVTSCVTADGIELWRRFTDGSGLDVWTYEATSVTRRAVLPSEVRPPAGLLNLENWIGTADAAMALNPALQQDGYEVVLQNTHRSEHQRIMRASGGWTSQYETNSGVLAPHQSRHWLTSFNESGFSISIDNRDGEPRTLRISRRMPRKNLALFANTSPMNKKDSALGEPCDWFDLTPNMMDLSQNQCVTGDGIVVKFHQLARGPTFQLEAASLRRGKIPLSSVLPPKEMLDPKRWGLSE